jgi:hypothetical protein
MGLHLVLVIVQKTKSVELLQPVQHFLFDYPEILNREDCISQDSID